jgi:hypothetical protein
MKIRTLLDVTSYSFVGGYQIFELLAASSVLMLAEDL